MSDASKLLIPIMYSHAVRSWPKFADLAKPVPYVPLSVGLSRCFPHDAHTAAYSASAYPRRLSSGALLPEAKGCLPSGVSMMLAIFDMDCGVSHRATGGRGDVPAPDAWWRVERGKLEALVHEHPGLFAYRTRHGYRTVGRLPKPFLLQTLEDAIAWSLQYVTWCAYLRRCFDIHADPSCKDWTRLYRLPHATRDPGGRPEERENFGDPQHIGFWQCKPTAEDRARGETLSKRKSPRVPQPGSLGAPSLRYGTGEGILFHAFAARGWIGREIEHGKWAVRCPWETAHTKGERFDTSTVLFAPGEGAVCGTFHCSHAHCQTRNRREVLGLFSRAELDHAREAAEIIIVHVPGFRVSHARQGIRTVAANEVSAWRR
jgi:hypothetical protein